MKIGIVILNYKTSIEIEKLLKTIEMQKWKKDVNIYVIDNNSNDNYLIQIVNKFSNLNIKLIFNDKNLGYAKGNNIGIKYALEDKCNFVIVSNPDICFYEDNEFLEKIKKIYLDNKEIALIGPSIINYSNKEQNPLMKNRFNKKTILKKKIFFALRLHYIYYFLRVYVFYDLINKIKEKNYHKFVHVGLKKSQYVYALNGCFLIFTPTFFKYFNGFDPNTFMYCEEHILGEKLYKNNLNSYFTTDIKVFHRGGKSVEKENCNFRKKLKFVLFNTLKSCSYFFRKVI